MRLKKSKICPRFPARFATRRLLGQAPRASLHTQLLLWLLFPLGVLWLAGGGVAYFVVKGFFNTAYDRFLLDSTRALAAQIRNQDPTAKFNLSPATINILRYDALDKVYFQIRMRGGKRLGGEPEFPTPPGKRHIPGKPLYYDGRLHGQAVRVAALYLPLAGDAGTALVQVAETMVKRDRLTAEILTAVVLPQLVLILVAVVFMWYGVGRGLRPLKQVQNAISRRSHRDLRPVAEQDAPEEVRPLVGAINDLMRRLESALTAQKRFVADAAHQLRTPLAGLKTQTEFALRQTDMTDIHHALGQISTSAERTTRLANQLLALARAEPEAVRPGGWQPVDLNALARRVSTDHVPQALQKDIDLGFEGPPVACTVHGDPFLLQEMLGNLLDNAIRYTPGGGKVTVRLSGHDDGPQLEVEDNGSGIPQAERGRVFERFYRVPGSGSDGSGLGLSIVHEIALAHGARVHLGDACGAHGTTVTVRFPHASVACRT